MREKGLKVRLMEGERGTRGKRKGGKTKEKKLIL
jgi:hypothetical protein